MRDYLAYALLLAAASSSGCKKDDPLFCKKNMGASGCADARVADDDADGDIADDDARPDAAVCFGAGTFAVCPAAAPTGTVTMPASYNTTGGSTPACATVPAWMESGQPDACLVVADSITVGVAMTVTGNRPLVLVAATTITLDESIDVASHLGGTTGPGSPSTACTTFAGAPDGTTSGGGGGAGGSFVTQGGEGGNGNNGAAAKGQQSPAVPPPTVLRAGCYGQNGGTGNGGAGSGVAGDGGGAIYLVAGESITIAPGKTINASGAGAVKPNGKRAGGAGGGSGGMIVLYAPMISATGAFLVANGGGGSSGADDSGGGNGDSGDDPVPTTPANPAGGGNGPSNTGDGGDGWALGDPQGANGTSSTATSTGGGGGGGGGGYIRTNKATGATTSPAEHVVP